MKMTIRDMDVSGKRVFVRVDFNVPFSGDGVISDDTRIRAALPTIVYLMERKARVVLASHFGRPKGKVVEDMRLGPVAERLGELLGAPVKYVADCVGPDVEKAVSELKDGEVILLENLRFHPEEEKNTPAFSKQLAVLADIYVNDAFGTAHRAHASTEGITHFLPSVAGLLMEKELNALGGLLASPVHPFACVFGGAKVSDKVGMITSMLKRVDVVLVGGGLAATFLKARGLEVGHSLVENDSLDVARDILRESEESGVPVLLPLDVLVAREVKAGVRGKLVPVTSIPSDMGIVDIGPRTIEYFFGRLESCRTIMWNGPMGVYEVAQFSLGTKCLINYMTALDATTVIGGGSSVDAVHEMGLSELVTHVSTGGGATLELLENGTLPGVDALADAP
ncbi:MAG: phosphoglycerate kinase [Dehalococcoidia bacterium]|nr:phosphoglycerate kinase [Dehalococcoidia bacterium]